jgi:predicted MFS family arabinose efflux permease
MPFAPWLAQRLRRATLPLLAVAVAGALLLPLAAGGIWALGAALFVVGAAVAALDVLANVEISGRETRAGQHLMGFCHAMFSFAFAGSAFVAALARQAGMTPADYLPVMALVGLLLAGLSIDPRTRLGAAPDPGKAARPLPWGPVFLTGLILFSSFIGENSTEAWSALHIERTLGAPAGAGGFGPATLGLVMGVARLCGQVVSERIGHARLILGSALLGICGALIIAGATTPGVVLLGVSIVALGMAVIVPSAMSILGGLVSEEARAHALSRAWMLGIVGFFVGPSMMGGIAQVFDLRASFVGAALIMALIIPAIWRLSRYRADAPPGRPANESSTTP